jgi:hypothetical protein
MFESLVSCFAFRCSAALNMTFAMLGAVLEFKRSLELATDSYFELVLRVVVEIRSSPASFGSPMASTALPV